MKICVFGMLGAVVLSALLLAGCVIIGPWNNGAGVNGNGVVVQKDFNGVAVEEIHLSGCWNVNVVCNASENTCVVKVEENIWEYVTVDYGKKLKAGYRGCANPTKPMTIELRTTADISRVQSGGACKLDIAGVRGSEFKLDLSGASKVKITDAGIGNAAIDCSGAGKIAIYGSEIEKLSGDFSGASKLDTYGTKIGRFDVEGSGASNFLLNEVNDAAISVSGACKIRIEQLNGRLTGSASGASKVSFGGAGTLGSFSTSGASSVRKD